MMYETDVLDSLGSHLRTDRYRRAAPRTASSSRTGHSETQESHDVPRGRSRRVAAPAGTRDLTMAMSTTKVRLVMRSAGGGGAGGRGRQARPACGVHEAAGASRPPRSSSVTCSSASRRSPPASHTSGPLTPSHFSCVQTKRLDTALILATRDHSRRKMSYRSQVVQERVGVERGRAALAGAGLVGRKVEVL